MNCTCPNCKCSFQAESECFGKSFECEKCKTHFVLDVIHLAKFQLPDEIRIQFIKREIFKQYSNIAVFAYYGYRVGPIYSNTNGQVIITKDIFIKEENDYRNIGIMDVKGDFSLNRFIKIVMPTQEELENLITKRVSSGWPFTDFEISLYGDIESYVMAAKNANNRLSKSIQYEIDLNNIGKRVERNLILE